MSFFWTHTTCFCSQKLLSSVSKLLWPSEQEKRCFDPSVCSQLILKIDWLKVHVCPSNQNCFLLNFNVHICFIFYVLFIPCMFIKAKIQKNSSVLNINNIIHLFLKNSININWNATNKDISSPLICICFIVWSFFFSIHWSTNKSSTTFAN